MLAVDASIDVYLIPIHEHEQLGGMGECGPGVPRGGRRRPGAGAGPTTRSTRRHVRKPADRSPRSRVVVMPASRSAGAGWPCRAPRGGRAASRARGRGGRGSRSPAPGPNARPAERPWSRCRATSTCIWMPDATPPAREPNWTIEGYTGRSPRRARRRRSRRVSWWHFERTHAWQKAFHRLARCYERRTTVINLLRSLRHHNHRPQPDPASLDHLPLGCTPPTPTLSGRQAAQPQVIPVCEPTDTRARCPLHPDTAPASALPLLRIRQP